MTQNWPPAPGQQWPGSSGWNPPASSWPPPPPPPSALPQPGAAFSQQPSYGTPGSFTPPPPRRRNPFLTILGGAVFVVIAAFFAVTLLNYLGGDEDTATPGSDPSYHQVSDVPAPDYNPPAIPQPKTYEQATAWMQKNAIYREDVPVPTNCVVPAINSANASTAELENHLNKLTACLWGVWDPPMTSAGFVLPRPPATVYSSEITTPCGKTESGNAFYCAVDQHIYYATDLPDILPKSIRNKPFVTDAVMAHEFGHAIQARTGILVSEKAWEQKGSEADGRVYSRRTEVQADCFAGLWVNAIAKASGVTASDEDNLTYLFFTIGDDQLTGKANYDGDHGLGKNRQSWFTVGLGTSQIGKCNTFTASANAVR